MSFSFIKKEIGTNIVFNTIAGAAGNFSSRNFATIVRSTTQARFGTYSFSFTTTGSTDGVNFVTAAAANAVHHVTVYVHGTPANTLQAAMDASPGPATWRTLVTINSGSSGWVRYQVSIPAAEANGSTQLSIRQLDAGAGTVYLDNVQVEESAYFTTPINGDLGKGYRWNGLKHASTSTRKDDVRTGGREQTLKATEGGSADILVTVEDSGTAALGMTGLVNNTLNYALQPGAAFQNTKLLSRTIELQASIFDSTITTLDEVLSERKKLLDILKPDAASAGQPTPFVHHAPNLSRPLTTNIHYESGLEISGGLESNREMDFVLRLLGVDPFWYEDDRERTALDFQDTDADADRAMGRIDGAWSSFGTGFNSNVFVIAIDQERNRVYFGGGFTTANGVVHNGITYWDGTDFVDMSNGVNGTVNSLAVAPNGDVWVGGTFTQADGVNSFGLAKWDISAGAWVRFTNGASGDDVFAIALDSTGRIYIGGNFLNWDGVANSDRIAQSTDGGANWTALGTGMNDIVNAFAVTADDNLYVGGDFTTAGGVTVNRITLWDGSTFTALESGVNNDVDALVVGKDGMLYIGGDFTDEGSRIVAWNGTNFETLGDGVSSSVLGLAVTSSGDLIACGTFTSAGGLSLADRIAGWNGSTWFHLDIDFPGSPTTEALAIDEYDDIYVGYSVAGTATIAGRTTVTNNGSASVSSVITILGPTTANSTATLQWLENQTTGERLYFDMSINTDEIITIDTRPGSVGITSSFRGTIFDNPLDPGGLSLFNLLPGDNVIAAFMTGTITGVEMFIDSDIVHHGIEGVAV